MSASEQTGCAPRRRELLAWAAVLGAVTAEALARAQGISTGSARALLAAAQRDGQMRSWRLLRGEPALHTVTAKGLRDAGVVGLAAVRLGPGAARHARACCTAAVSLAAAFPRSEVLGEPAVRRSERSNGGPFATLPGRLDRRGHRPDLLLVPARPAADTPVAVEVELTVKAPERLATVCTAWARSRAVAGVLYLAAPEVIAPLGRAIARAGAGDRVVVLPLETLR
jgi:hypothetical protein